MQLFESGWHYVCHGNLSWKCIQQFLPLCNCIESREETQRATNRRNEIEMLNEVNAVRMNFAFSLAISSHSLSPRIRLPVGDIPSSFHRYNDSPLVCHKINVPINRVRESAQQRATADIAIRCFRCCLRLDLSRFWSSYTWLAQKQFRNLSRSDKF